MRRATPYIKSLAIRETARYAFTFTDRVKVRIEDKNRTTPGIIIVIFNVAIMIFESFSRIDTH